MARRLLFFFAGAVTDALVSCSALFRGSISISLTRNGMTALAGHLEAYQALYLTLVPCLCFSSPRRWRPLKRFAVFVRSNSLSVENAKQDAVRRRYGRIGRVPPRDPPLAARTPFAAILLSSTPPSSLHYLSSLFRSARGTVLLNERIAQLCTVN